MTKTVKYITLVQSAFLFVMLVFWVQFAYLGVLLTNVIQVSQASTLLSTQDLFVVRVVNVVLSNQTSIPNMILNLSLTIPLGYVAISMVSIMTPHPRWRLQNRIHCVVCLGVQAAFLLSLAYMMNNFTTLGHAISVVHTIGWITGGVGLVIAAGCVYTLVRLMFDFTSSSGEEKKYD